MTALAPHLSNFLREHLPKERSASQHTCEAYAHSFQLLLCFAASRLKLKPTKIEIEQLDVSSGLNIPLNQRIEFVAADVSGSIDCFSL